MENQIVFELCGQIFEEQLPAAIDLDAKYNSLLALRHSGANDLFPRSIVLANRRAVARNVAPRKMLMELPMIEYKRLRRFGFACEVFLLCVRGPDHFFTEPAQRGMLIPAKSIRAKRQAGKKPTAARRSESKPRVC